MKNYEKKLERIKGCLIGGAVGDALGYPVEFDSEAEIFGKYGTKGVSSYELNSDGVALISDDTQMTLFTAVGATKRMYANIAGNANSANSAYVKAINMAYREWYYTQTLSYGSARLQRDAGLITQTTWLFDIPSLYSVRAPGNTCLSAIVKGCNGTMKKPINDSYGCGGVMRVAPIGLLFASNPIKAMHIGVESAALTHGHALGYFPAAVLAHMISTLTSRTSMSVETAALRAIDDTVETYGSSQHMTKLKQIIDRALRFSTSAFSDIDVIRMLGEGWTGEEALAIAIYCAARHEQSFENAVRAAVSHGGDSDSTGAITGNIIGARLGICGIPEKYLSALEHLELINDVAEDIAIISSNGTRVLTEDESKRLFDRYVRNEAPSKFK